MSRKVLVSMDESLLRRVDEAASAEGLSRSGFLARAARGALGEDVGPGADPHVGEALELMRVLAEQLGVPEPPSAAVRRSRDDRTRQGGGGGGADA